MKALRFHAALDVRVDDVPEPPSPAARQVLVAPALCGICGTDIHEYQHGPMRTPGATPHPLTGAVNPQILGHEFSGKVLAVGEEVERFTPGDRVSVMPLVSCGRCVSCLRGEPQLCSVRASVGLRHPWGGMAEYALTDQSQLTALPDGVGYEQGALVEPTAVATAAVAAGGLEAGASVLVCGAGPIGASAAIVAAAMGAGTVIVSEPNGGRAARLAGHGMELVDPRELDLAEHCLNRFGGVDLAVECSGSAAALRSAAAAVRPGGSVVVAGVQEDDAVAIDARALTLRGISLIGSVGYPARLWPRILALMAAKRLPVEATVSGRVPLADAVEGGFRALTQPGSVAVKVLIECNALGGAV